MPFRRLVEHPEFVEGTWWRRRSYPAGAVVFHKGDPGRTIYLIRSGSVRISGEVVLDEERHIRPGFCDLGTGESFGELALFDSGGRTATVEAISDLELAEIDGGRLLEFFDAHPDIGYEVLREMMQVTVRRLRASNERVLSLLAWGLRAHGIDRLL